MKRLIAILTLAAAIAACAPGASPSVRTTPAGATPSPSASQMASPSSDMSSDEASASPS